MRHFPSHSFPTLVHRTLAAGDQLLDCLAAIVIVSQHAVTRAPAQQLVHRRAQRLAFDVPEGDVDSGDGGGQDALRREEAAAKEQLPDMLCAEWVLADEQGPEMLDGASNGQLAPADARRATPLTPSSVSTTTKQ